MATSPIPPDVQKKLYAEADARFWAQTGYKPGHKLDAKSPLDKAMIPTYLDIYQKILNEYRAGKILYTYDHPAVVAALGEAAQLAGEAAHALGIATAQSAAGAPPHAPEVKQPLERAHEAHVASQQATAAAAAYQPPTVSPAHAAQAAQTALNFVMNGAGQGVPVIGNPDDAIAAMQASAAPGKAAAQTADTPEQAAATATHGDHHKFKVSEEVGIGLSIAAALGLVVYGVSQHSTPRRRAHRTYRMRRRAA